MQVNENFFNILWPIPFFFHCSAFYADCYFFIAAHDSLTGGIRNDNSPLAINIEWQITTHI